MKGTARKSVPGTRVATVTGIQTCWPRRSICSTSSRCTSRRIDARLLGDEPSEVAGLAVEGEHLHEPVERVHLASSAHSRRASTSDRPWRIRPATEVRSRPIAPRLRSAMRLRPPPSSNRPTAACRSARSRPAARGRSAAASGPKPSPDLLFEQEEREQRRADDEEEADATVAGRGPRWPGRRRRRRRCSSRAGGRGRRWRRAGSGCGEVGSRGLRGRRTGGPAVHRHGATADR